VPRSCTICAHPAREAIDQALAQKRGIPRLAAEYRVSEDALLRHRTRHLPALLVKAHAVREVTQADDLLGQLRALHARTLALLDEAEQAGKVGVAFMGIGQARGNLELMAKLMHQLEAQPTVNIMISAEWVQVRSLLLATLAPYPEARLAVARALQAQEVRNGAGN
jgi:hypothetical protein